MIALPGGGLTMRPRILIAEDDDLQGQVLQAALEGRGYEADIVTDGLEAIRRLRTGRYDLALLDYHLPEVDGLAAAHLLHDFLSEEDCPRLIAVTATAEFLTEKDGGAGRPCFDAVVSKRIGVSALLTVIDDNLTSVAALNATAERERARKAIDDAATERRLRWLAPLAAVPALAIAGLFMAAFGWAATSLHQVDATTLTAQHADSLAADTAALAGAMQDAALSQRTYLATGLEAQRLRFEADTQRVDQLLVSSAPLSPDGAPGFGASAGPQAAIEPWLRVLTQEAQARRESAAAAIVIDPQTIEAGREAVDLIQGWASSLVTASRRTVFAGLHTIRHNVELVLIALAAGIAFGIWSACRAVQRRWRTLNHRLGLHHGGGWGHPNALRIPPGRRSPLLMHDG